MPHSEYWRMRYIKENGTNIKNDIGIKNMVLDKLADGMTIKEIEDYINENYGYSKRSIRRAKSLMTEREKMLYTKLIKRNRKNRASKGNTPKILSKEEFIEIMMQRNKSKKTLL